AEHICFERDVEHVRPGNWIHTGQGRGAYEKIEDMQFVGQGRGSWDRERLPVYGWRCNICCLCFCGLLLLAVIVSLVMGIFWRQWTFAADHHPHSDALQIQFDCALDYFHWETVWTDEKKAFCCAQLGKGCAVTTQAPAFDCDAAYDNWHAAWSKAKKVHCCATEQRGCSGDDCYEDDQDTWTDAKRTWCCQKHALGCPKDDYDCRAGVTNWRHGWSESKKYFCCKKYDVACPDSVVYDCSSGIPIHWPSAKQAWCCHHGGHCATTTYDCTAGYADWQSRWSDAKADWCCSHEQKGCQEMGTSVTEVVHHVPVPVPVPVKQTHVVYHSHPVPVPVVVHDVVHVHQHHGYDCWHGADWSPAKRHYCCSQHNLGCSSHVHVVHVYHHVRGHFDCQAGQSSWQVGWSVAKKHWCCVQYMVGCPEDSGASPSVTHSVVHTYENGDDFPSGSVDGLVGGVADGDLAGGSVNDDFTSETEEGDSVDGDIVEGSGVPTESSVEVPAVESEESDSVSEGLGSEGSSGHPFLATPLGDEVTEDVTDEAKK
ncbi:Pus1, partial [Symbiodinium sp. CCMP2456]